MLIVPGSINADLLFKVDRLPRPGETVLCPGYTFAPGGKGANQAAAAAKAGARVLFVGKVGDDAYGPVLRRLLEEAGVDCSRLATCERPTGIAVIGIDAAGENAITVGSGANLEVAADQIPDELLAPGTTVLCQNEIRAEETAQALRRAHARGARTILNLAPAGTVPDDVLAALDLLIVNEHEAASLTGRTAEPNQLATELSSRHGLTCVLTLGAKGAIAVGPQLALKASPLRIRPVDTTGAGDTFAGALAAWLDGGASLPAALAAASVAAALSCEHLGAQTAQPTRAMIEARLPDLPPIEQL
jgi:ribokinase